MTFVENTLTLYLDIQYDTPLLKFKEHSEYSILYLCVCFLKTKTSNEQVTRI